MARRVNFELEPTGCAVGGVGEAGGAPGAAEAPEEYEVEGEIPF